MLQSLNETWKEEIRTNKYFLVHFFLSVVSVGLALHFFGNFVANIELRPGTLIDDPILKYLPPTDVTWHTFILIYVFLLMGIVTMLWKPRHLITMAQTYTFLVLFRWIAMYLLPLEAPQKIITLQDPVVELFTTGQPLTKDLFFSGHTSTVCMVCLNAINKKLKILFGIGAVLVGMCVLIQHVHYTVDVYAAPFFSYTSYRLSIFIQETLKQPTPLDY